MVEVKLKTVDINKDILFEIAQEIFKGEPKAKQAKQIKEVLEKAPSIEKMREELELYKRIAETILEKIKEEELRRRKETNHLIEKKIRTIKVEDEVLAETNRKEYKTRSKRFLDKEIVKYTRKGNSIECIISNKNGRFKGVARRHEDDKFDYESGMKLARIRAMKNMFTELESCLVNSL